MFWDSSNPCQCNTRYTFEGHFAEAPRLWEHILTVLVVVHTASITPYEAGFLNHPKGALYVIDFVVDALFAIDIILTFFVAYFEETTKLMVDDRWKIAKRYGRSWLALDVLSTTPSGLILKILPKSWSALYVPIRMLRLWRLQKVVALFDRWEKHIKANYFCVRLVRLICVTLFSVHCSGCFFYKIAMDNSKQRKTWIGSVFPEFVNQTRPHRYLVSTYWSLTTLTTIGYEDLHPNTQFEIAFALFYMLINLGLVAYVIGNVTNWLVDNTSMTLQFQKQRDATRAAISFAKRNQLSCRLQTRILFHLDSKFPIDSKRLDEEETLKLLPKDLRFEISYEIFKSLLENVYLFNGVSKQFLCQLVTVMELEYFSAKQLIIMFGEVSTDLYILVSGKAVGVNMENLPFVKTEIRRGNIFGEIGVLCNRGQVFEVGTRTRCEVLRLNGTKFLDIVHANIGDEKRIVANLIENLNLGKLKNRVYKRVLSDIERMRDEGNMDLPRKGDNLVVQNLLKTRFNKGGN